MNISDDSSPSLALPFNASTLPREKLIDRIKGVIYGNCIGDAIGLSTEFMNRQMIDLCYPEVKRGAKTLEYSDIHPVTFFFFFFNLNRFALSPLFYFSLNFYFVEQDEHRNRWERGDWTDDSDQMILIMQSLMENQGHVDPRFDSGLRSCNKRGYFWKKNSYLNQFH